MKTKTTFFKRFMLVALFFAATSQLGFSQRTEFSVVFDAINAAGGVSCNDPHAFFAGGADNQCIYLQDGQGYVKIANFPLNARTTIKINAVYYGGTSSNVGVFTGCAADGSGGTMIGSVAIVNGTIPGWTIASRQDHSGTITAQTGSMDIWLKKNGTTDGCHLYAVEATGPAGGVDAIKPTAPAGVVGVSSPVGTGATITWTTQSTDANGIASYIAYNGATEVGRTKTGAGVTSMKLYGLTGGTAYNITVVGVDPTGNMSAESNVTTFSTSPEKTDLASGMTATATEEDFGGDAIAKYGAIKVTDGLSTTWWQGPSGSAAAIQDVIIDLGTAQNIDRIEIDWKLPGTIGSLKYTLQSSTDNVTFTDIAATPTTPTDNTENTFVSKLARYVRIHVSGVVGTDVTGIYEARVYNVSGAVTATYTVTVSALPLAGGSAVVSPSGAVASGSIVSLTATPNAGYSFTNWTDGGSAISTSATYSYTVTATKALVANFTANAAGTYSTTVNSLPVAGGTTTITPSGAQATGTSVTLTATAFTGYKFVNWKDGATVLGVDATYTFTVGSADKTITANFAVSSAIESANEASLSIFPNPVVNNNFTINYNNFATENVNVSIFDALGNKVYSNEFKNATSSTISVPELKGLFFVKANNGASTLTSKIVIE